jgi:MurNAc alpha-1-phosphate uridylyltransferase
MSAAPLRCAMLLAAGKGERMRPLTEDRPKPLIEVAGRTLIDHALDRLVEAGIGRVVVNSHYRADQLEAHLAGRDDIEIAISREETLLDTGGGVRNALALLGEGPFLVANTDILWLDGPENTLACLAAAWRDEAMDALLLMHEMVRAGQFEGKGDFMLDAAGIARRRAWYEVAPFLFSGVQILHSRLFEAAPEAVFSLNRLFDDAEQAARFHGMVHDGLWLHVGTPEGLAVADAFLREGRGG